MEFFKSLNEENKSLNKWQIMFILELEYFIKKQEERYFKLQENKNKQNITYKIDNF